MQVFGRDPGPRMAPGQQGHSRAGARPGRRDDARPLTGGPKDETNGESKRGRRGPPRRCRHRQQQRRPQRPRGRPDRSHRRSHSRWNHRKLDRQRKGHPLRPAPRGRPHLSDVRRGGRGPRSPAEPDIRLDSRLLGMGRQRVRLDGRLLGRATPGFCRLRAGRLGVPRRRLLLAPALLALSSPRCALI
jgi:hypothetical protein